MATRNNAVQNVMSPENLRQVFETAVVEIHQAEHASRRLPIVQRNRPVPALNSPRSTEKRAVSDAARALAQLWKIPTFSAR
jgi:hypothetical protein